MEAGSGEAAGSHSLGPRPRLCVCLITELATFFTITTLPIKKTLVPFLHLLSLRSHPTSTSNNHTTQTLNPPKITQQQNYPYP